jgi:GNAT superfamily N-acetyltransferase
MHLAQEGDAEAVQTLFLEYAAGLGIDLSFQGFEAEVADPFSVYDAVLLADGGCAALRRVDDETCELKRLYVRESARGSGLGRQLAEAAIAEARRRGYRRMVLDTLPSMTAARTLYTSLGFREIAAYRFNPIHGTTYFELELYT